jgi:hypothetical protein
MSHASQALAANDGAFQARCEAAAENAARNIYNEVTTLNGNLQATVAVTTIPITPNLSSPIAAGTVISVGGEDAVATLTASGASAIGCASFTPTRNHVLGDVVSPPTIAGHVARAQLAVNFVRAPDFYKQLFTWGVAVIEDGNLSATDAAIDNDVSSIWNVLAGA